MKITETIFYVSRALLFIYVAFCLCEFTIIQHQFRSILAERGVWKDVLSRYLGICVHFMLIHTYTAPRISYKTCKLLYFVNVRRGYLAMVPHHAKYKGFLCEVKRANNGRCFICALLIWILFSFWGLKWFCYKIDFTRIGITGVYFWAYLPK